MGIYLRNMEMPESCIACRFGKETNYAGDFEEKCLINDKHGYVSIRKPRLDTCPLVEVKEPHGRLGDLDELKSKFRHSDGDNDADSAWISAIRRFITQADTIIEPEGREECLM